MSERTFDVERYRREKLARLERENDYLRRHRAQLERLLAITLQVATKRTGASPTVLLAVLEEIDRLAEAPSDSVAAVLRETAA